MYVKVLILYVNHSYVSAVTIIWGLCNPLTNSEVISAEESSNWPNYSPLSVTIGK
jgi:hypothetical protein